MQPPLNEQKAVGGLRVVGDPAEIRRSRVDGRAGQLRLVQSVQSIQANLERDLLVNPDGALDIRVQPVQSIGAAVANPAREHLRLKRGGRLRRIGHEPGGVEPFIGRLRPAVADTVRVAIVKDIGPGSNAGAPPGKRSPRNVAPIQDGLNL